MLVKIAGSEKSTTLPDPNNALYLYESIEKFAAENTLKNGTYLEVTLESDILKSHGYEKGDTVRLKICSSTKYTCYWGGKL